MSDTNPHDRLLAEAEAWPLLSPTAYTRRMVRIIRERAGVLAQPTREMARELEERLRHRAQGDSLARLGALREIAWFDEERQQSRVSLPLHEYLSRVAKRHLELVGTQVRLLERPPSASEPLWSRVMHWRWLSLRLPQDILVSALHAALGTNPGTDRVSLLTPHLREVLSSPVAETHLHEKAAFSFSLLWTSWMGWLLQDRATLKDDEVLDGWPLGNPPRFVDQLYAAAIARYVLARYVERIRNGQSLAFGKFCREVFEQALEEDGRWTRRTEHRQAFGQALRLLREGRSEGFEPEALRDVYWLLVRPVMRPAPRDGEDIRRRDPIFPLMQPPVVLAETVFATRALQALSQGADEDFACFFWQYQRVRCNAHALLTLEPGTAGLDWFEKTFSRLGKLRGDLDHNLVDAAFHLDNTEIRLDSLELRRSPKPNWEQVASDCWRLARNASRLKQGNKLPGLEVGVVFHFIKESRRSKEKTLHADPGADTHRVRFGDWFSKRQEEAEALRTVLRRHPEALVLIRGVDVAGAELAVPTWPLVKLFQSVREASAVAARELAHLNIPPVRVTCHAGEEYRRLVEGLRRIHELVAFGILRTGDRIGHGLALGVAPSTQPYRSEQPLEDRIDDLLWELDRYRRGDLMDQWGRTQRIITELIEHIGEVYDDPSPNLDDYLRSRRILASPEQLERLGFPRRVPPLPPRRGRRSEEIAHQYLTSEEVFIRGQRPVMVDRTPGEVAFLEEAQRWLRQLLARMEVTVECNPSSNLLIGHLGAMEQHPVRTLTLGPRDGGSAAQLMVSINTDDPITFATCLADEYAHLHLASLRQGLSAEDALAWADRVRLAGWRSRFTLPASTNAQWLKALGERWRPPLAPMAEGPSMRPREEDAWGEEASEPESVPPAPSNETSFLHLSGLLGDPFPWKLWPF